MSRKGILGVGGFRSRLHSFESRRLCLRVPYKKDTAKRGPLSLERSSGPPVTHRIPSKTQKRRTTAYRNASSRHHYISWVEYIHEICVFKGIFKIFQNNVACPNNLSYIVLRCSPALKELLSRQKGARFSIAGACSPYCTYSPLHHNI